MTTSCQAILPSPQEQLDHIIQPGSQLLLMQQVLVFISLLSIDILLQMLHKVQVKVSKPNTRSNHQVPLHLHSSLV